MTEENNKFELHKFPGEKIGGVSYENFRDEIEKDLQITDITASELQDDIIGPIIIVEYREHETKRMKEDKSMKFLAGYIRSIFQDFESYHRTEVDLVEDDIKLVVDEYNSSSITYELEAGVYTLKDFSVARFNVFQPEYPRPSNVVDIEFDDITTKTERVVIDGVIAISIDENRFLILS